MGKVSLFIMLFISLVASLTVAEYMYGKQLDGRPCDDYRCCSQFGYCGSTNEYCSPNQNYQSNCVPFGEVVTNVTTYYSYLNQHDYYDLNASNVECSQWYSDKSFEWRSRYEWTGFCGPLGPQQRAACGKCLKVTNLAAGTQTTVRIVDTCGIGGLDLDEKPLKDIDTDGNSYAQGRLTVSYEFVECGDEDEL